MGWIARILHLDDSPVTDEDRAELAELRDEVTAQRSVADVSARRTVGVSRYFSRMIDENHLAERWRSAMRGG
jgi:hypothetical protein